MRKIVIITSILFWISMIIYLIIQAKDIKKRKNIEYKSIIIPAVLAIMSTGITVIALFSNSSDTTTIVNNYNYGDSNEQLLKQAEKEWNAGNVKSVLEIYSNPLLDDSVTVNLNMGYIYAKGIYVDKSVDEALKYYNHALELGYQKASLAIFAMYLETDINQAINYLHCNSSNESINNLIIQLFGSVETFSELYDFEIEDALWNYFFEVEESLSESRHVISSNDYEYCTLINTRLEMDSANNVYANCFVYKIERKVLKDPESLDYIFKKIG